MYRLTSKSSTFAEAFQVCLRTKTQTGRLQSTLLRTGRIAKLDVTIDATELKGKRLGTTARAATSALQKKYGLQITDELDPTTTFGKTTREAVVNFQRASALPIFSDTRAFVGIFGSRHSFDDAYAINILKIPRGHGIARVCCLIWKKFSYIKEKQP